ncbi:hypothetical protein ACMYSN_17940 [Klebsiella sp. R445]
MEKELFGFIINHDVQFDISNRRLVRISAVHSERTVIFGAALLNETLVRFLRCLLTKTVSGELNVPKKVILKEVWEDYGMSASSQLLWRTVRELKAKVVSVGLDDDFIGSVSGRSYSLNTNAITPLFY